MRLPRIDALGHSGRNTVGMVMIASFGSYLVTLAVAACIGLALALLLGAGPQ
jgi:hypothetical protein